MKITSLLENTAARDDMRIEHGLSLLIETGTHRILFDMGQSDAFLQNAEILGESLETVDLAILSHGHYDHGGGLSSFLTINDHAPVYISRHAFGSYRNGTQKYIGLDPSLATHPRLVFTDGIQPIGEKLTLYTNQLIH